MNNKHVERGLLLIGQRRFETAEEQLRQALAQDPDIAFAHSLLGLCLSAQDKHAEALAETRLGVHGAPDLPFAHRMHAQALAAADQLTEAQTAVEQAIRLDPGDDDAFALLASIHLQRSRWKDALEAAGRGLAIDPENVKCTNIRSTALTMLGRRDEARESIDGALAKDPHNATSHANMGWSLLSAGQPKEAMEHFREALRLEPEMEWARHGIVEAMKARNIVYRQLLRFSLFLTRFGRQGAWLVIIGLWLAVRVLGKLAREYPALAPWITPIIVLYMVFALFTWIGSPLFNLILRVDRFGRLALSREETIESNWIGGLLLAGLACLALTPLWGLNLLVAALVCGFLTVPVAGTFKCRKGRTRIGMTLYTAALAVAGVGGVALMAMGVWVGGPLVLLFVVGVVASSWVASILVMSGQ